MARRGVLVALVVALLAALLPALSSVGISPAAASEGDVAGGEMRITEWMYDGPGGEFVELTNVGTAPVDLVGWRYGDSSIGFEEGFDLSGFGVVEAGESVVLTESVANTFRNGWGLCATVKVVGGSDPGLSRDDQINIYDGAGVVVDRLAYGDEDFPGTIRTTGASGWVSAAGLGADDPAAWTLSTVGDAEGSVAAASGAIGSPGRSTRATVSFDPCAGEVRITEWMYDGAGGEFVELTNVGDEPVDLAGWRYDDDSASYAEGFDLSGFGLVAPGESVVFSESDAESFRADWGLCAGVQVLGGYTNNLGRADQINVFDAGQAIVDRLAYGDQAFPGTIRTTGASGWVSAAGLGADDPAAWTLSTVGDGEGSLGSIGGAIGSPGRSTRASVPFDPCALPPIGGQMRITEWMYDGTGGEFVELTNVGDEPVDLAGWRYDDDSASYAEGFDLSGFGLVAPGESVVFSESDAESFRADWGLCAGVQVLGGYTNNLGRADQINVFDAGQAIVDRLAYGDQAFPGTIRTTGASGWVSAAGLGADDPATWTLSTVGDGEGSVSSTGGAIGSPGRSTRAIEAFDPCGGEMRITEWMYNGESGEWIELTNVGEAPIDLAGWRYDDDSASYEEGFDLSGFGLVAPGESVVLTEDDAESFRANWGLCSTAQVLGGYTNNLGRADQINLFDAGAERVDQLTYGDEAFPGTIRADGAAGWVSAAGLGADDITEWTLATVGDAESSHAAGTGDIGSPGRSTRATVAFDACPGGGGDDLSITVDRSITVGSVGDPTNPTVTITLDDPEGDESALVVTAQSSNGSVLPTANVTIEGSGAERTATLAPTGRGLSTVTFTVTSPDQRTGTVTVSYGASNQAPDASGRYFHTISDASAALDVGDGYVLLANDETNTLFLFEQGRSGPPVKTWTFTSSQLGTSDEIDLEAVARSGDTLVWSASHGNNRSGEVRTERRTMFATTITGSGAGTELTFAGRYDSLWGQLRTWDQTDGHGLGANALDFVNAMAPGVLPNAPGGFNVEGFEFAPDGTTGYLGLRAPTVEVEGEELALIVPVTNVLELNTGLPGTTPAQFGAPIMLDLDGRSIRDIRRNDHNEYLISAGPSPSNETWALYTWDGIAGHDAAFNQGLPTEDLLTGGTWESIVSVPHPLTEGAVVHLVTDSGDTNFYGTGATKDLSPGYQKSYTQDIVLDAVPEVPEGDFVLTLLHNNDGESKVLPTGDYGGAARFKSLVDQLKATAATEAGPEGAGRGTVMISSGDNFLAGPNFAASQALPPGSPFYDSRLVDLVGYDAMVVGNHEFDFGPDVLAQFIEGTTDVPFLSSNLDVSEVPSLQALAEAGRIAPWTIVERDGEKVGIIGATTEGLASISSPGDVVINQVLPAVQAAVTDLEELGVDKVILASHLQDINNELALVAQLRGVDIVISGGGDELLGNPATDPLIPGETPVADYPRIVEDAVGTDVPVVTTAGDYKYVGRLKVRFDAEGNLTQVYEPESQPIRVSGAAGDPVAVTPDATVHTEVEAPVEAYTAGLAANVIAQTEVPLDGRNPQPIRRSESNLGNLAADSLLWRSRTAAASGTTRCSGPVPRRVPPWR